MFSTLPFSAPALFFRRRDIWRDKQKTPRNSISRGVVLSPTFLCEPESAHYTTVANPEKILMWGARGAAMALAERPVYAGARSVGGLGALEAGA